MKKIILVLAFPFSLSAQSSFSVESVELGSPVTHASTLSFWIPAVENSAEYVDGKHFTVTNTSASTITLRVRKTNISMVDPGAQSLFCTGLNCYSPMQTLSNSEPLNSQAMFDLKCEYKTAMMAGVSRVQYTIFDVNNTSDSLSFIIDYNISTGPASVQNQLVVKPSVTNPMPNPATGVFSMGYKMGTTSLNDTKVVVYNMLGAVVLENEITETEGIIRMDAGTLSAGVYFCTLVNNGRQLATRRLVVTH